MATIDLRGITVAYGSKPVLDRLDLTVRDGEFLVLVGPSGCGKTTVLRVVAGLLVPTAGQVLIDGEDVGHVAPAERDLAMVFQSYALYPHMTVRQNMAFALRLARVSKKDVQTRVESAAEALGLTPLLDRRPKALSGGQRQRVAMGRAIVREPRAFLMDEPLSNLDAKLRGRMRAEIARIQRNLGTTTLYVTHDQVEAMTMADRIAVLHEGKLQQIGTPDELFDSPANVFVAAFIGSPPINIVSGRLEGEGGRTVLRVGAETVPLPRPVEASLESTGSGDVLVGIRPHDLHLDPPVGEPASLRLDIQVDLVERLGTETLVHGEISGATTQVALGETARAAAALMQTDDEQTPGRERTRFAAALGSHVAVKPDSVLPLHVPVERLHLFDAQTGASLQSARPAQPQRQPRRESASAG